MPFPALVLYASAVLHIGEYLLLAREGIKAPASRYRAAFCERLRVQQGRSGAPGPRRTTARRDQRRGARQSSRPLPGWDHRPVHQHLRSDPPGDGGPYPCPSRQPLREPRPRADRSRHRRADRYRRTDGGGVGPHLSPGLRRARAGRRVPDPGAGLSAPARAALRAAGALAAQPAADRRLSTTSARATASRRRGQR
jgi:hypothetical protein